MTGKRDSFEIDLDGVRLAAVRQGCGTPVLFVHGSASDMRIWEAQIPAAAETFEAIAYSRRWHRPNPRIAAGDDYAMARHGDDLEAVIGALDRGPVHLVAHSYGAVLALIVAGRRPDLLRSLVLIEPPAFTLVVSDPPCPGEMFRLMLRRPALAVSLIRMGVTALGPATKAAHAGDPDRVFETFGPGVLGRSTFDALPPEERALIRENVILEEFTGSGFVKLDPEALRRIAMPVLLVCGADSPRFFGLLADEVARLLPDVRRTTIAGATHDVQRAQPEAFNAAMTAFLGQVPEGR